MQIFGNPSSVKRKRQLSTSWRKRISTNCTGCGFWGSSFALNWWTTFQQHARKTASNECCHQTVWGFFKSSYCNLNTFEKCKHWVRKILRYYALRNSLQTNRILVPSCLPLGSLETLLKLLAYLLPDLLNYANVSMGIRDKMYCTHLN